MKTLVWLAFPILCGFALAQDSPDSFDKAPAPIDEALRARVQGFYQAHVDGKFRQADQFVAEDSKDAFFVAEKPKYLECRIAKINYLENFTKATVVTACKDYIHFHADRILVTMPITSRWKLDNGTWYWYFAPETEVPTPFGTFKPGPEGPSNPVPAIPSDPLAAARQILSRITVEPASVTLDQTRSSVQEVHMKNGMPGPISISVESPKFAGLTVTAAKTELGPGEEIPIAVSFNFDDPAIQCQECLVHPGVRPPIKAVVRVAPTGQQFPIEIVFTQPKTNQ